MQPSGLKTIDLGNKTMSRCCLICTSSCCPSFSLNWPTVFSLIFTVFKCFKLFSIFSVLKKKINFFQPISQFCISATIRKRQEIQRLLCAGFFSQTYQITHLSRYIRVIPNSKIPGDKASLDRCG